MQGDAISTRHRGYPVGRVIVTVENGVPQVVAFLRVPDAGMLRLAIDAAGTVVIDTAGCTYLAIDADTLRLIGHLAEDGRDLAADLARCWDNGLGTWVAYGHLVTHPRPIDLHETLA